jgi:hypothetical protein
LFFNSAAFRFETVATVNDFLTVGSSGFGNAEFKTLWSFVAFEAGGVGWRRGWFLVSAISVGAT